MKNQDIVEKVKTTFKERNSNKQFSERLKQTWKEGKLKPHRMTDEEKQKASERLTQNNPMKNEISHSKMVTSLMKTLKKEDYVHPNKGRVRRDVKERMNVCNPMKNEIIKNKRDENRKAYCELLKGNLNPMKNRENVIKCVESYRRTVSVPGYISPIAGENHYMVKNPKLAKEIWKKSRKTLQTKGMISKGETLMLKGLDVLGVTYEPQQYFLLNKEGIRCCFVDAYLPKWKVALEYDGFSSHYFKNKERDEIRDKWLFALYGVKTIRFDRKSVFQKMFLEELSEVIHGLEMGKD